MIRGVIFDFDGVIVESVDIKTKAFAKLFEHETQAVVKEIVEYHLFNSGVSRFDKIRHIYCNILKRGLDETMFGELCERFAQLVADNVISCAYVKGAKEFLDAYHKKYKMFIVSATPQNEINDIVKARKLDKFFAKIYGAPLDKKQAVRNILLEMRLASDELVYIGDALSDYEAAADSNVKFIARIHKTNAVIFRGVSHTRIKDLTELLQVIQNL